MRKWEDILTGYLEGTESRADAEALRMRIYLPAEERGEVEGTLRLVDLVSQTLASDAPAAKASDRLVNAIENAPSRSVPAGWRMTGSDFESDVTDAATEEALNQRLEGARMTASVSDTELTVQLDEFKGAKEQLAGDVVPEGAVDRLLARLRSADAQSEQPMDGETARQVLNRLKADGKSKLWQPLRRPDVLAASADVEPETPEEEKKADKGPAKE